MNRRPLLVLLLAVPGAWGAETVVVDVESRWISDAAPVFGEYADVDDAGSALVGGIDTARRWLDDDAGYWRLWARGIGLDVYDGALTFGRQGTFEATLGVTGREQVRRIDGVSPYRRAGDRLELPGDWVSGARTTDFAALGANVGTFRQRRERDRANLEGSWRFAPAWTLGVAGSRELVSGTRAQGGVSYVDASRGYVAMLPVPVDQEVSDLSAVLGYARSRLASNLSLRFTRFDNDVDSIDWTLPFTGVLDPAADFPSVGRLSQAPDHDRIEARLDGSFAPAPGLGLSWDAAWARTMQDDPLLPYTANPALAVSEPVPVASADAELETLALDLRAVWRPQTRNRQLRRLTLRGALHLDDRDRRLARAPFRYVRGDGADQPRAELAILNAAYDRRREATELAADYRLPFWSSRFTAGWDFERIERDEVAVAETEEDRFSLAWRANPLPAVTLRLEATRADRAASTYDWRTAFLLRRTAAFVAATPDDARFTDHPLLRQYHLANAETDALTAELGWLLSDAWYVSLQTERRRLDHDATTFGLTRTDHARHAVDLQYTPSEDLTAFVWAEASRYEAASTGRAFAGGAEKPANRVTPPLPQGSDPRRNWTQQNEDQVRSIGAGLTWTADDRLEFEFGYSFVATRSGNDFTSGGAADLDASPLPTLETRQHALDARSTWQWRPETSLSLHYRFFRFEQEDWARAGFGPTTLPTVLSLGEDPFDDDVHFVGASVRHAFD